MTAKLEDLGSNKVRMEIEVPPERLEKALDTIYRRDRNKYVVPGFRKGKAPRKVIESRFGEDTFYGEAMDLLFREVYPEVLKDTGVEVVSAPENITVLEASPVSGVTYEVVVYKMPEVELGSWEGLHARRVHVTVTDEMVQEQIQRLAQENARWVEVDRPAETGDLVVLDYAGSIDGVPFDGGSAKMQSVVLGSDTYIAGFENQIVSMKPGEQRTIKVRFPAKYPAEELAGKDADFVIDLHTVRQLELPELDDDFVQDVSEYDTMDELAADIRTRLEEQAKTAMENDVSNQLVLQVVQSSKVEIPPPMIANQLSDELAGFQQELLRQGTTLEQFLADQDVTMEQFQQAQLPKIESDIRMRLVVDALIGAVGVEVTDADRDERIASMAERQQIEVDKLRSRIGEAQMRNIDYSISIDLMLNKLLASAVIEDVKAEDLPAQDASADGEAPGGEGDAAQPDAAPGQDNAVPEENSGSDA